MTLARARPWIYAAGAAALASWVAVRWYVSVPLGTPGPDIDQAWAAAGAVLRGQDAYGAVGLSSGFAFPLYYPLTTAVISLPLALLPIEAARLVFVAGTAGLLGFSIGKYRPELWPMLLSIPFLIALRSAQWTPLLTAGMIVPALGWLGAAKPNLAVAMLAGSRSRRQALILVLGALLLLAASLLIDPGWPWKWRAALASATHFRPLILRPFGLLVLALLLRWRDADARLLLALAVVPMTGLAYDALPAILVARTWPQCLGLVVIGWASTLPGWVPNVAPDFAGRMWLNGTLVLWFVLLPAAVLVLWRERKRSAAGVPEQSRRW